MGNVGLGFDECAFVLGGPGEYTVYILQFCPRSLDEECFVRVRICFSAYELYM